MAPGALSVWIIFIINYLVFWDLRPWYSRDLWGCLQFNTGRQWMSTNLTADAQSLRRRCSGRGSHRLYLPPFRLPGSEEPLRRKRNTEKNKKYVENGFASTGSLCYDISAVRNGSVKALPRTQAAYDPYRQFVLRISPANAGRSDFS